MNVFVARLHHSLTSGANMNVVMNCVMKRPHFKLFRMSVEELLGEKELQLQIHEFVKTSSLSPELKNAMLVNAKQYFELVTKIDKHKQVAAFMKQFATKTKTITDIVRGLGELLLPRHPEAFLGKRN
ncbi:hypothetical protein OSTOST_03382 [Ostertagia ostertagi]